MGLHYEKKEETKHKRKTNEHTHTKTHRHTLRLRVVEAVVKAVRLLGGRNRPHAHILNFELLLLQGCVWNDEDYNFAKKKKKERERERERYTYTYNHLPTTPNEPCRH